MANIKLANNKFANDKFTHEIQFRSVAEVKALIAKYDRSDFERWPTGYLMLSISLSNRRRKMAKLLLKSGFPVNCNDVKSSNTPLHNAVKNKDIEMVMMILKRGANVNAKNGSGKTPLHLAVESGNWTNAKLLLDRYANVNVPDMTSKSPIYYAIAADNAPMTELLLRYSCCANVRSPEGDSPLQIAVNFRRPNIVKRLKSRGASLVPGSNEERTMPLHHAIRWDNTKRVKLLLDKGADVNAANNDYVTPLYLAMELQNERIVKVLLQHKDIDVESTVSPLTNATETPLFRAALMRNERITKMLLDAGARVSAKNKDGDTALDVAIAHGDEGIITYLLDFGAAADYDRFEDSSPLHIAAIHCLPEVTWRLFGECVDVDRKNKNGQTALHQAAKYGNSIIVESLLHFGADVNAKCNMGFTPFHHTRPMFCSPYNDEKPVNGHWKSMITGFLRQGEIDYDDTAKYIQEHIVKLVLLNRYVSEENIKLLIIDFKFWSVCKRDVKLMKRVKIGKSDISYYDILAQSTDQLAILSENKSFWNALETSYRKEKFYRYHEIIKYHLEKGEYRGDLFTSSLKCFNDLSGFTLPKRVLLDIFIRLSNEDLKNLINAGTEKNSV